MERFGTYCDTRMWSGGVLYPERQWDEMYQDGLPQCVFAATIGDYVPSAAQRREWDAFVFGLGVGRDSLVWKIYDRSGGGGESGGGSESGGAGESNGSV